ncbi:iron uptake transporter deferrochelatase/peroxidase subunit [Actinotalea sp. M2MS4P-6]|uniref:iron uptake transporter deferrochelatase/peroxidase subunit n=1 Tax=Actinotalea sp. M2MS4P-6 TaxID=2983762 RepID=UPI0021E45733|nr:iron uptake transporter deferrochelatase/peroxidase subunit [Actinotalea sp. M2MS4P-6]MCV2393509.1 iron uptake transporter deferrochelatase/peroxidase subunit [Actinotalea sp. M2MS4P-6]
MTDEPTRPDVANQGVSRRGALAGGLALGGLLAAGGFAGGRASAPDPGLATEQRTYPFAGTHQAGIVTPQQDRMYLAAFDLTTDDRAALVDLLRRWTTTAARLTQGLFATATGFASGPYDAPPEDTGEAADLPASGLTVTVGFGRSLFVGTDGRTDRFGLAGHLPDALAALPHFPGDQLDAAICDGDLLVQACADDPQVAVHAIHTLSRAAFGTARVRWTQLGFGRTSATSTAQSTPRNLFGFKDGTANVKAEEAAALEDHVWVQPSDAEAHAGDSAWMTGGTYFVGRRIRMLMETWDRTSLREQETTIGRSKREGAPLSGGTEHTAPDFAAAGGDGRPLIDATSHVHLAHPSANDGVRMLRRGYTFTDGNDAQGHLDAGLYFIAYVRDPRTGFVPVQQRLASADRLSEYLKHTGSALFAVPPGVARIGTDAALSGGEFLGSTLLG